MVISNPLLKKNMYQATQDIISRVKSKTIKIYCKKGDFLLPVSNRNPLIVATKKEIFSVLDNQIKKVDMNPQKLLKAIMEVADNPHITNKTFPYEFVTGISNGKDWEQDFLKQLKSSDIEKTIKQNLLDRYEAVN